jgi:hypothetical protein
MNKYGSVFVLNTTSSFSIFFRGNYVRAEKISSTDYDSSPLSLLVIIAKKFMGLFFKDYIHSLNMLKSKNELARFPPGIPIALVELKNTYYINKAHALFNNTQDPSGRVLEGKAILFCIGCFKYALGVLESQASQAKEK